MSFCRTRVESTVITSTKTLVEFVVLNVRTRVDENPSRVKITRNKNIVLIAERSRKYPENGLECSRKWVGTLRLTLFSEFRTRLDPVAYLHVYARKQSKFMIARGKFFRTTAHSLAAARRPLQTATADSITVHGRRTMHAIRTARYIGTKRFVRHGGSFVRQTPAASGASRRAS